MIYIIYYVNIVKEIILCVHFFQLKPSQYMFQMSMNTEQKLANMHTINIPRKTELLDMSEISHQKVRVMFNNNTVYINTITSRESSMVICVYGLSEPHNLSLST